MEEKPTKITTNKPASITYSINVAPSSFEECLTESLISKLYHKMYRAVSHFKISQKGESFVSAAFIMPVLVVSIIGVIDLAKTSTALGTAQSILGLGLRLGVSTELIADVPPDPSVYIRGLVGEDQSITSQRAAFWSQELNSSSPEYRGVPYYTQRELKLLNKIHGLMRDYGVLFPIPVGAENNPALLQGKINCSVKLAFTPTDAPPSPFPTVGESNYLQEINESRDRKISVRCLVPVTFKRLLGLGMTPYLVVERSGVAWNSGSLNPLT